MFCMDNFEKFKWVWFWLLRAGKILQMRWINENQLKIIIKTNKFLWGGDKTEETQAQERGLGRHIEDKTRTKTQQIKYDKLLSETKTNVKSSLFRLYFIYYCFLFEFAECNKQEHLVKLKGL